MNGAAFIGLIAGSGLLLFAYKMIRNDSATSKPAGEGEGTDSSVIAPTVLIPSDSQREEEKKHTLEVYSQLWKKDEHKKNTLKELARIWRKDVNDGSLEAPDKPLFLHREIRLFYKDIVEDKPFFVGNALRATVEILQLLDTKGKCPSVVNKHKDEPEKGYDKHIYTVLKKIPLYEHTVNVAREIVNLVPDGPMVPKAVISALAHDLGKITQYYDKLQGTGIHAFIGVSVLDKIPSLQELKYFDEIVDAVKNHHRNPEAQLGQVLKKADQEARRKEVSEYSIEDFAGEETVENSTANPASTHQNTIESNPLVISSESSDAGDAKGGEDSTVKEPLKKPERKPKKTMSDLMGAGIDTESTPADLFGENGSAPSAKENDLMGEGSVKETSRGKIIRKVKIPWFDADAAIKLLAPVICSMQGSRWSAISMPDGTIYVRPDLLFSVAEKLSNNAPDIKTAQADQQTKDNIIFSMVNAFRDMGAIEKTMVSENYSGAQFVINPGQSGSYEAYLIPFKAEALKFDLSTFEARKGKELKKITEIKPKAVMESQ